MKGSSRSATKSKTRGNLGGPLCGINSQNQYDDCMHTLLHLYSEYVAMIQHSLSGYVLEQYTVTYMEVLPVPFELGMPS